MGRYHTAQICRNGHVITTYSDPEFRKNFCTRCGAGTITQCEKCCTDIRGYYEVPGVIDASPSRFSPPSFCYNCGHPFPWTATRLQAAQELADELEELSDQERAMLKQSLDEIIRDTPRTE